MNFINTSPVEVNCHLDKIINKALKSFTTAAIISTPRTFEDVRNTEMFRNMSEQYFIVTLGVEYLKTLSERLVKWENDIDEYFSEFDGKWKFYAASKRLEFLKEYSGDDEDYDPETGEIRTEGLPDSAYEIFTILHEIYDNESRDIIQDFFPADIMNIISVVKADASIDLRKAFGVADLPTYTFDENGDFRRMTFAEQELSLVNKQVEAGDISSVLTLASGAVWHLCHIMMLRQKEHLYEDNTDFLCDFRNKVEKVRQLDFDEEFVEEIQDDAKQCFSQCFDIDEQ